MDEAPRKQRSTDDSMGLYDWVQCIVIALICGILVFIFLGRIITVDGTSMLPTLVDTDRVVISNLFYTPKNGDIVVLQTDTFGSEPLVKRIIAVGGQTVEIDFNAGVVYVNGSALVEPYTLEPTLEREDFSGPISVPEGCVFVMGDNRNGSTDSRSRLVGLVDTRCILGKVLMILMPGSLNGQARDWSRIGGVYG